MSDDVTMFPLEEGTSYTAKVVAILAPGVTKEFIIPNIIAGREINMSAYQSSAYLSPVIILSLIVITAFSIIILVVSVILFLMSQTW